MINVYIQLKNCVDVKFEVNTVGEAITIIISYSKQQDYRGHYLIRPDGKRI